MPPARKTRAGNVQAKKTNAKAQNNDKQTPKGRKAVSDELPVLYFELNIHNS